MELVPALVWVAAAGEEVVEVAAVVLFLGLLSLVIDRAQLSAQGISFEKDCIGSETFCSPFKVLVLRLVDNLQDISLTVKS